ncbi:MAG: SoxR reducing system RseC family protein [Tissierellia bacterium]|jgi:sigma-E factor negative regulatory protein RseC|nr:SoxR reducing system RseC family protein [Tissierellia bacterium]
MEQVGFVRDIKDGKVELEIKRVSGCGENCKGCGSSCDIPAHIITLPNKINAQIGDFVEIKGEPKKFIKYAMIVYMIPIIFLIGGIALGSNYFKGIGNPNYELLSFVTGLVAIIISYFFVRLIDRRILRKGEESVRLIKII